MGDEPHDETTTRPVLIAGGGSGGHLSPALAIAERLAAGDAGPAVPTVFVCSERSIDEHMLGRAGVDFVRTPALPPALHPTRAIRFLRSYRRARDISTGIIRTRGVRHVLATGGFVSVPAVAAARRCGIPVTLLNLDDPPGKANRWIAPRATSVLSAIELPRRRDFAECVVGLPIRRCAMSPGDPAHCRKILGLAPDRPTLLVTGASQGATSLNRFVTTLAVSDPGMFGDWQILHLTGHGQEAAVREAYAPVEITVRVEPFLDEMGLAWGAADLAVSRAGANSVAEAHVNAVPCLFLPYPHHRDMHQRRNAQPSVDLGGATLTVDAVDPDTNVARIGPVLRDLLEDSARRGRMRAALQAATVPDAATLVADRLRSATAGAGRNPVLQHQRKEFST